MAKRHQKRNGDPPTEGERQKHLRTASEIVVAIGGNSVLAKLTGRKTQHITNWKAQGTLPPATYLVVTDELRRLGYDAPPELWRIISLPPK